MARHVAKPRDEAEEIVGNRIQASEDMSTSKRLFARRTRSANALLFVHLQPAPLLLEAADEAE